MILKIAKVLQIMLNEHTGVFTSLFIEVLNQNPSANLTSIVKLVRKKVREYNVNEKPVRPNGVVSVAGCGHGFLAQ